MKTKEPFNPRSFIKGTAKGFSIALFVVLAAGCASVNRLREAQDAFNQAGAAENSLRFDAKASDAVAGLAFVRSGYASALLSLEKLEGSKEQTQLRNEGLWGTALTLKALTQWRLGHYDRAITNANLARQSAGDQIFPRDLAVLTALPGLVKTDQAYEKILRTNSTLSEVEELLVGSEKGAVANIQKARAQVDKDHPVQIYLLQAQLAAYRNLQVAYARFNSETTPVPPDHHAKSDANAQLKELKRALNKLQPGEPSDRLVNNWKVLCGLEAP